MTRRCVAAWLARVVAVVTGAGRAGGARLRDPRGRRVRGRARPGAPDDAAPGDVAAAHRPGHHRRRDRRRHAGPGQRRRAHLRRHAHPAPGHRVGAGPGGAPPVPRLTTVDWLPTRAFGRAVLVAGLLLFAGVLTGRYDLVVLAAPFALGTALSLRRRPRQAPVPSLSAVENAVAEGDRFGLRVSVANHDPAGLDMVLVRLEIPPWLRVDHGDHPSATP